MREPQPMGRGNYIVATAAFNTSACAVSIVTMTTIKIGPAKQLTLSPRAELFERLGLCEIRNKLADLDLSRLEEEREKEIAWLKSII